MDKNLEEHLALMKFAEQKYTVEEDKISRAAVLQQLAQQTYEKIYLDQPTVLKVAVSKKYKKTGIWSGLRYDETKPAYVDWGDGTSYEAKSDLQQLVHEYAAPGEYVIKLYNLKSIAVSTFNAAWRNKESQVAFTLREVTCLGELMSEVQDMAFFRCKALETASLPLSLPSVGAMVFRGCCNLKHVDLPAAEHLSKGLCCECSSLQEVEVQEGTKKVGNCAFRDCTSLTSVSLPASVEHVEQDAFSGCSSLGIVYTGSKVRTVEAGAFKDCKQLEVIVFDGPAPDASPASFDGSSPEVYVQPDTSGWPESSIWNGLSVKTMAAEGGPYEAVTAGGKLTYYVVHNEAIVSKAALQQGAESVEVPVLIEGRRVTRIEDMAFAFCFAAREIKLPPCLRELGTLAFYNCTSLSSLHIPLHAREIGKDAFINCKNLKDIYTSMTCEQARCRGCDTWGIGTWHDNAAKTKVLFKATLHCSNGDLIY